MTKTLAAVAALAALSAAAALGAGPSPDAHDRALAHRLDAKVQTFREIAAQKGGSASIKRSLDRCPLLQKDPGQAFAALLSVLPALMTEVVNRYGPRLRGLERTINAMHPHSRLFASWLAAEGQSFALILRFDNHGKKVDLCKAAEVMLDKKSTAEDVHRVLGIDPSLIVALFQSPASATLTELNSRMRAFFVAAGLPAAHARALTS